MSDSRSVVPDSVTPGMVAWGLPLSMEFSRQEYWSGLPYPKSHVIYILEKKMATHSRILAWKIPWTEEPGLLQSLGVLTVRHDLSTE